MATGSMAPDGGVWAWMAVFACFMGNVIGDGVMWSFGVLIPVFKEHFVAGTVEVVAVHSIQMGVSLTCGPIASFITNRLGWRWTTVIGSILLAVGLAASAVAPNLICLYLSGGVCLGLGLGITLLSRMDCITQYFDKLRPIVTGIAKSGSGIGTLIFAPLTQWLIDRVGWQAALFIIAGICLLNCFFGLMFQPLPKNLPYDNNKEAKGNVYEANDEAFPKQQDEEYMGYKNATFNAMVSLFTNVFFMIFAISNFLTNLGYAIPYTFLPENTRLLGLSPEQGSYLLAIIGITNTVARIIFGCLSQFVNRLFLYSTGLVICGLSIALSNYFQPMLISIIGGNCTSLMVTPKLEAAFNCTELIPVMDNSTIGLLNQQIIETQDWVCSPLVGQTIYASVFGFTGASYMTLNSLVTADLVGADIFTNAYGLILLFQGVSTFIGPPIVGFMFDSSCSYTDGFMLMGAMVWISGFMIYFILYFQKKLCSDHGSKSKLVPHWIETSKNI